MPMESNVSIFANNPIVESGVVKPWGIITNFIAKYVHELTRKGYIYNINMSLVQKEKKDKIRLKKYTNLKTFNPPGCQDMKNKFNSKSYINSHLKCKREEKKTDTNVELFSNNGRILI